MRRSLCYLLMLPISALCACGSKGAAPTLSKSAEDTSIPAVPIPPENGPRLGSVANLTPVFERPASDARELGYLHAGARVARSAEPFSRRGCGNGWYPVRPRGFVCASVSATTDMTHPTLLAMATAPALDKELPYTYARTHDDTPLFERDPQHDDAVRVVGSLKKRAGMAVVGSWSARDPDGNVTRLALLTSGRFVRASDLQAVEPSTFHGLELKDKDDLPAAFVVKRGVHAFHLSGDDAEKTAALSYHQLVHLSGRFHSVGDVKYWATSDGQWLRHRDVVTIQTRSNFPDLAQGTQKWLDVSVVTGTLVAYEGHKPVFATLVSVNRDAHGGDDKWLGTFEIVSKEITLVSHDPKSFGEAFEIFDAPWALTLSNGMLLYGAYWHDRFGVDHGPGSVELSPSDAARIQQWVSPTIPDGWHGLLAPEAGAEKTLVVIRK
ncbi:MAG TPA: L,D-transpeptidase [Polyangiaceae bacterium]